MSLVSRISRAATAAAVVASVVAVVPTTALAATAPATPGVPVAGVKTASTIAVTWAAPADTGGSPVTKYELYRDGVKITSTPSRQYTFGTLTGGTSYALSVSACNLIGCSATSAATDVKTSPALPTQLRLTPSSGALSVSWTASANAADGSESVWFRPSTSSTWSMAGSDGATSPATISGLSNGVTYAVRVRVSTSYGDSGTATALATPMAVPSTPTLSVTSVSTTGAVLGWDAPDATTAAPTYYEVYRDGTKIASPTTRSYAAAGLTPDSLYAFSVKSCNSVGCSSASSEVPVPTPPAPATKLAATAAPSKVTIAWTNSPQGTRHVVQYKESAGANWLDWDSGQDAVSPVDVTGLRGGVRHAFRVVAYGSGTAASYSSSITATPIGVPAVVTGLRQTAASNSGVTVSWAAPASGGTPITGYKVYVEGDLYAERPASSTSVAITAMSTGARADVTVAATNALGEGPASAALTAYANPAAATGFAASPAATSIAVSWTASASSVSGYKVFYRKKGVTTWASGPTLSTTDSSTTITGLVALTEYEVYLRATTPGSFADTAVTTTTTLDIAAPTAPTAVVATPVLNGFTLTWNAPADNGGAPITDYVIYYQLGQNAAVLYQEPVSSSRSATITGLAAGSYTFTVRAKNSAGLSALSSSSTASSPYTAPGLPLPQNAAAGTDSNAVLTWEKPVSDGNSPVVDYVFQFSTNGGTYWTAYNDGISSDAETGPNSLVVTGLTPGTEYMFRVAAKNAFAQGLWAEFSQLVTPVDLPAAPRGLAVLSRSNGATLISWSTPVSNGSTIEGYVVEESDDGGTTWVELTSWWVGTTSEALAELSTTASVSAGDGVAAMYRVAALSNFGVSAWSSVLSVTSCQVPSAPTSLTGTPSSAMVALSWTAPTGTGCPIVDYSVQFSSDGGVTWQAYADSASTATSLSVVGLANGVSYIFRVRASNSFGYGVWSSLSSPVTPFSTPGAPTAVGAKNDGDAVAVTWSAPASTGGAAITNYSVQYSSDSGSTWMTFVSPVSTSTSLRVTGLSLNTTYVFRVRAVNVGGPGAWSTSTSALVYKNLPSGPQNLAGSASDKAVSLTWDAPSSDGGNSVTDYVIQYKRTAATTWTLFQDGTSATSSTSVTGLTNGYGYVFRIAAVTSVGTGEFSTATAEVVPFSLASAPSNVSGVIGSTSVRLTWTAPADTGGSPVTDYEVQFSSDNGTTWASFVDGVSASTTSTVTGLTNGTPYVFRVRAVTVRGAGAWSSKTGALTPATVASAPTNVAGVAAAASVQLSWVAPLDNGGAAISDYVIQRAVASATPAWTTVTKAVSTASSFTATGLLNGTAYIFRVAAKNSRGTSVWSSATSAVTPKAAPGAPTGAKAVASSGAATLTWLAPASNNGAAITDYVVQYSSNAGTLWTEYAHTPSTALTISVTGLTNGTAYIFRIAAVNSIGTGAWATPTASVTPKSAPSAPSSLVASSSNAAVVLAWSASGANGSAVTDYVVQYSADDGSTWMVFAHPASTATAITVSGLTNGTNYTFRVAAKNVLGTGVWSSTATATPRTLPSSPSSVRCTAGASSVTLTWSAPTSDGGSTIVDYNVQVSATNGLTWLTVQDGVSTGLSTVVTGLQSGTTYIFRVAAVGIDGQGPYSSSSASCTL